MPLLLAERGWPRLAVEGAAPAGPWTGGADGEKAGAAGGEQAVPMDRHRQGGAAADGVDRRLGTDGQPPAGRNGASPSV
jgi:hypothetical protein